MDATTAKMTTHPNIRHTLNLSEDDEVANIDAELRRIHAHITQLREESAALLRRRNELRAFTRVLPSEILSLIFQYACPPANFFEAPYENYSSQIHNPIFHFTLASVSSLWREVVLSTPQLWTSILRTYTPNDGRLQKWEEFFRATFDRSNGMPLEMAFRSVGIFDDEPYFLSAKVDAILLRNQHRIQSVRVEEDNVAGKWMSLLSNFTQLTTLSLTPSSFTSFLYERVFSVPTNLTISQFRLHGPFKKVHLDIPWTTVTILDLSDLCVDVCLKFLVGCPNVVEFRCSRPRPPEKPHDGSILTELQELANLETLGWCFLPSDDFVAWNDDLLKYIRAPSLKTLCWDEDYGTRWDASNAPEFLKDLPLTLKNLELVEVGFGTSFCEQNLFQYIHSNSQVESVMLQMCGIKFMKTILRLLSVNADEGAVIFPDLKNITIEWWGRTEDGFTYFDLETGELLVGILQSRWSGGYIDQFTVVIDGVYGLNWKPSVVDDLNELLEDGLDLVAIHNGTSLVSYSSN